MGTDADSNRVIARRSYRLGRKTITALIFEPVKCEPPMTEWRGSFRIEGLAEQLNGDALGIDSLQALTNSIQGLRLRLESLELDVTWFGGEKGDTGISRFIPGGHSLAFEKRAERLVEEELTKFVRGR